MTRKHKLNKDVGHPYDYLCSLGECTRSMESVHNSCLEPSFLEEELPYYPRPADGLCLPKDLLWITAEYLEQDDCRRDEFQTAYQLHMKHAWVYGIIKFGFMCVLIFILQLLDFFRQDVFEYAGINRYVGNSAQFIVTGYFATLIEDEFARLCAVFSYLAITVYYLVIKRDHPVMYFLICQLITLVQLSTVYILTKIQYKKENLFPIHQFCIFHLQIFEKKASAQCTRKIARREHVKRGLRYHIGDLTYGYFAGLYFRDLKRVNLKRLLPTVKRLLDSDMYGLDLLPRYSEWKKSCSLWQWFHY